MSRAYRDALDLVDLAGELGLRDGAVLALAAAGVTAPEMTQLEARCVRQLRRGGEDVVVVQWPAGGVVRQTQVRLPIDLGARVLSYLAETGAWGTRRPLFPGRGGEPLSYAQIRAILVRYSELVERRSA